MPLIMNVSQFTKPLFILFALGFHLLLGMHGEPSQLVLCFGEDGHVAFEILQHETHKVAFMNHDENDSHLESEENCKDINISLGHDEIYQSQNSKVSLPNSLLNPPIQEAYFIPQPETCQALILAMQTQFPASRPPDTEAKNTLKNTILLI